MNEIRFHPFDFTSLIFIIVKNIMNFSVYCIKSYIDKELISSVYNFYDFYNKLFINYSKKILLFTIVNPIKYLLFGEKNNLQNYIISLNSKNLKEQKNMGDKQKNMEDKLKTNKDIDKFLDNVLNR